MPEEHLWTKKEETTKYQALSTTFASPLPTKTNRPDLENGLSWTASISIGDRLIQTILLALAQSLPVVEATNYMSSSSFYKESLGEFHTLVVIPLSKLTGSCLLGAFLALLLSFISVWAAIDFFTLVCRPRRSNTVKAAQVIKDSLYYY